MATHESDMLNAGYCEHLTSVNATKKVKLARFLIVLITLVMTAAMLFVTLNTIPPASFMIAVIMIFFARFVFQFTKIEYEYTVATGVLSLSKIYGARKRKDIMEIKLSDISRISPVCDLACITAKRENIIFACRKNDENAIMLVYNQNKVLVISAPQKTIACLKYYKKTAFVNM